MPELKPDWRRVRFGDVVRQVKDRVDPETCGIERFVAGEHMDTDDLTIRRWGIIGEGDLGPAFHMRFRPGQVLYGSRRTYLRKIALADFEGVCANTTFVLEPADRQVLLPDLLPFIMQTEAFHAHSRRESKGSVNPYINFSDLAWYEFSLPPLQDQRKLITVLCNAAEVVEAGRQAIEAGRRIYVSALSHTLMRPRPKPGISPETWGPEEWPCIALDELTLADAPISYGIVQPGLSVENGIPTVTSNNLNIGFTDRVHLTSPVLEAGYKRSRIRGGDVLVTVKGFGTGNIGVVPPHFSGNITRDVARIRFEHALDAAFFVHLWRSPAFDRYWRAISVGTTRPELSIGKLRSMTVPWPDREIRQRLSQYFDQLVRTSELELGRLHQSLHLLKVLVRELLEGEQFGGAQ